jgi:hypothetical protein
LPPFFALGCRDARDTFVLSVAFLIASDNGRDNAVHIINVVQPNNTMVDDGDVQTSQSQAQFY